VRILIIKLSSLGDVVHAMPAVQDIRRELPHAQVDWVVERPFAALVARCEGVQEVIGCELRRWRKAPLASHTRSAWRVFSRELRSRPYDAVIDLQGLTKSALVARAALLAPGGKRYAMANRTDGSSYEAPTRWFADVAIALAPHVHAVTRSRELCARALAYAVPAELRFGLKPKERFADLARAGSSGCVALVHGTSRADKCWPEASWIELGRLLIAQGLSIGLPHGDDAERERSERIAAALGDGAQVWPRSDLGAMADRLAACAGVIGVDSGLSHVAVALGRPHVQIYNFDTAWRTGPLAAGGGENKDHAHQVAVFAQPTPSVQDVWRAWCEASAR
jgi:heptosyltransferase I